MNSVSTSCDYLTCESKTQGLHNRQAYKTHFAGYRSTPAWFTNTLLTTTMGSLMIGGSTEGFCLQQNTPSDKRPFIGSSIVLSLHLNTSVVPVPQKYI